MWDGEWGALTGPLPLPVQDCLPNLSDCGDLGWPGLQLPSGSWMALPTATTCLDMSRWAPGSGLPLPIIVSGHLVAEEAGWGGFAFASPPPLISCRSSQSEKACLWSSLAVMPD